MFARVPVLMRLLARTCAMRHMLVMHLEGVFGRTGVRMLSVLAVCYLFLGGAGAGALLVAHVLDLAWAKTPLGMAQIYDVSGQTPAERCVSYATLAGTCAVLAGAACLLLDLGRVDRVLSLFMAPTLSVMAVGAYALAALAVIGVVLSVVHFAYAPWLPAGVVRVAKVAAIVLAVVVMTYTGLLLMSMPGVAFWRSPLLVALFALSSLSCGTALVVLSAALVERDAQTTQLLKRVMAFDAAVIALEALVAAAFVGLAWASAHPAVSASARELLAGSLAELWWVGFVACGLVAPAVVELAALVRLRLERATNAGEGALLRSGMLLCVATLVLVGGVSMRFGIAEAGQHRALELQEPMAIELSGEEVG